MKPTSKGRPKGKSGAKGATRQARRQKLAAAVIAGKPIADVAKEEGVSRSWASRETNAPATRVLIDKLLDSHQERIAGLIPRCLDVIENGFEANDGLLPDHRVRLLSAKRLIELCSAGRKHEEGTGDVTLTWQQFVTIYQEKRQAKE